LILSFEKREEEERALNVREELCVKVGCNE
jgi:hypothetical protein